MLLNLINSRLQRKITSYKELIERSINKINYYLTFPNSGFSRYHVNKFIKEISKKYDIEGKILLDVGAGNQPYKIFFNKLKYESCDSDQIIKEMKYDVLDAKHDFYCNINERIPRDNKYYDIVLCSEVLEHVYDPKNVVKEISRILKDDGIFVITVPQCGGEHMLPHNYFNYLSPGIEHLLKENNLTPLSISKPSGGFHLIGNVFNKLLNSIFSMKNFYIRCLLFPLEVGIRIAFAVINFLFFYLDVMDRKKSWVLHYFIIAKKNKE